MDLTKFTVLFEPIEERPDIFLIKINWCESEWDRVDWNTNKYYRIKKLMFKHPISTNIKYGFESIRQTNVEKFIQDLNKMNITHNFIQPKSDLSQLHLVNIDQDLPSYDDDKDAYEQWLKIEDMRERDYFYTEQALTNPPSKNHFETLPVEIIEKIFNYSPQKKYVNTFKQVCSKWHSILSQPKF